MYVIIRIPSNWQNIVWFSVFASFVWKFVDFQFVDQTSDLYGLAQ